MPRAIECFLIEPTNHYWVGLRRYNTSACPGSHGGRGYHNAEVSVAEVEPDEEPVTHTATEAEMRESGWPTRCDFCPYEFTAEDSWQVVYDRQYEAGDGRRFSLRGPHHAVPNGIVSAPAGAIWRTPWLEGLGFSGPDGCCYMVRTPGGDWTIDFPTAVESGCWTRSGVAPKLTVRPSILIGSRPDGSWAYHGILTDGRLVEC